MEMEASCLLPIEHWMRSTIYVRVFDDLAMAKLEVYIHIYGKLDSDRERGTATQNS
jgi:hypothetical protein